MPPPTASAFPAFTGKGLDLELSGADPFNSIFLPITKAMRYHHQTQGPYYSSSWRYFRMVFGLCVLDAPMVAAHVSTEGLSTSMTPWVRLLRHEPRAAQPQRDDQLLTTWVVDAVHRDYVRTFIDEHLLPFAEAGIKQVAVDAERILHRGTFPRARLRRLVACLTRARAPSGRASGGGAAAGRGPLRRPARARNFEELVEADVERFELSVGADTPSDFASVDVDARSRAVHAIRRSRAVRRRGSQ